MGFIFAVHVPIAGLALILGLLIIFSPIHIAFLEMVIDPVCTLVFAVSISVPIGVMAAYRQGSLIDRAVMGFSVLGFSVPGFVIGYCLIYVFAIELGWLPVQGYIRIGVNFWGFLERMILPSLTLSVGFVALISRITRALMASVIIGVGE